MEEGRHGSSIGTSKISRFGIQDANGVLVDTLTSGMPVNFQIEYETNQPGSLEDINITILIKSLKGDLIANLDSQTSLGSLKLPSPEGLITCNIAKLPIAPGIISISLLIEQNGQILDIINDAFVGDVDSGGYFEKRSQKERSGWLLVDQAWKLTIDGESSA